MLRPEGAPLRDRCSNLLSVEWCDSHDLYDCAAMLAPLSLAREYERSKLCGSVPLSAERRYEEDVTVAVPGARSAGRRSCRTRGGA